MSTSNVSTLPIACNLDALNGEERLLRSTLANRLRTHTQEVIETETGYAVHLSEDVSAYRDAFELALLEHRCCPFLRIELALEPGHGPVWFTLGGGPGVKAFLAASSLVSREDSDGEPCCP